MKSPVFTGAEAKRFRFLLVCVAASGAILLLTARYVDKKPKPAPFRFPSKELAAIDRDLQARFAIVPDKDFGIERTYGNQHYLYDPHTPAEIASVNALKKQKTQAAFYLMSRALWLRHWDGWGYKPIQGPVVLTGKITLPLPRKINFYDRATDNRAKEIIDQDDSISAQTPRSNQDKPIKEGLPTHNPDGKTVPSPTPPKNTPTFNQLQAIGNRVFEMAEAAPKTANIGVSETVNPHWKVVAVPIRASNKACLPCHTYEPYVQNPNAPQMPNGNGQSLSERRIQAQLGDALGVAFYLYNSPSKPVEMPRNSAK